jgi:hypothetical protein
MVEFSMVRRSLVALALCSAAIAASSSPASARSHHHGVKRSAHAGSAGHSARRHYAQRSRRHFARTSRWERGVAQLQTGDFANTQANLMAGAASGAAATLAVPARPALFLKRAVFSAAIPPAAAACGARAS